MVRGLFKLTATPLVRVSQNIIFIASRQLQPCYPDALPNSPLGSAVGVKQTEVMESSSKIDFFKVLKISF